MEGGVPVGDNQYANRTTVRHNSKHSTTTMKIRARQAHRNAVHARSMALAGSFQPRPGLSGAAEGVGLGFIPPSWLLQGLTLAFVSEGASKAVDKLTTEPDPVEELVRYKQVARALDNPFEDAEYADAPTETIYLQHPGLSGLGSLGAKQGVGLGNIGMTLGTSAIKAGSTSASQSSWLAAMGGPIGLSVAGATIALQLLWTSMRKRGARKVATTQIVDEVEPVIQQNLAGYLDGPRTETSQAQALANFDAAWDYVVDNCKRPEMGTPGEWCVEDRQPGGKWDWFARYRDPIADDPDVIPDPPEGYTASVDPETGERRVTRDTSVAGLQPLLLGMLLIGGAMMFGGGGGGNGGGKGAR